MREEEPELPDYQDHCDACGFETRELMYWKVPVSANRDGWFCNLCCSTFSANTYLYPDQYPERKVMQMIAHVGNLILQKIEEKK